jgi:dolichyl-phosphate beta-glucosyltransferase
MTAPDETTAGGSPPFLTLILPAYNESRRLPRSLAAIRAYLERAGLAADVIVVDDGSEDGTSDVVTATARAWPAVRLLRTEHRGKGHAVRTGLLAADGVYSFICDADLSMPIAQIARFLPPERVDVQIAIGTREGPGARRFGEPWRRHLMGRVFNALVRALALPGIQDSQCGFKCLRTDIGRELAAVQTIDGWGFDVELLYVARQRGYRIEEVPIDWHYEPSSRISPLRDSWRMTREVLAVRRHARQGCYDGDSADARGERREGAPASGRAAGARAGAERA